jgi:hypothetical protein
MSDPTEVAFGRAVRLAAEAMHAAALQRRRLATTEPEDEQFVMRWWADFQFFMVALRRLRRAAELAALSATNAEDVRAAIRAFSAAVPALNLMRNVGEHIDDYVLSSQRRRHGSVEPRQLEVATFDGRTVAWLGSELDVDEALAAAERLYRALTQQATPEREDVEDD